MVARVTRELLERGHILPEAAAAPTDSRAQEVRAEPVVEADPAGHVHDVGADQLADVRNLVDEADPGGQERVRGELDHLGRGDVGRDEGRLERAVERRDAGGVLGLEGADHDPVGMLEVADGRALGEELGVRDVADVAEAAHVEVGAHLVARADRDGALHHQRQTLLELRQGVDDRPDGGEVGVAGVGRRRAHRDEGELGAVQRLVDVEREREPLSVPGQEVLEARLVDRHPAGTQLLDPLRKDVAHHDVVAQVGETGTGDEADVAGAEDRDPGHPVATFSPAAAGPSRSRSSSRSRAS